MTTTDQPTAEIPVVADPPAAQVPAPPQRRGRRARRSALWWVPDYRVARLGRVTAWLPRKQPGPEPLWSGILNWTLGILAALIAWLLFYALGVSALQHSHSQSVLYAKLRQEIALETAPIGNPCNADSGSTCGPIAPGTPIAVMSFPAAGLHNEVVVEGTAGSDLTNGPGHLRDTPLPGQAGTSVVFGRAKLFGGPFHAIASTHVGDQITVTTGEGVAQYVVSQIRHSGDRYPQLAAGAGRLILVTATGGGWRSGWAPSQSVYVDATLKSAPFADAGFRPTSVPSAENPMQVNSSALYVLVLWLPVLAIGALLVVWAQDGWGRWQAWLVGTPVILAGLWGVSQTAVQLLPNLM